MRALILLLALSAGCTVALTEPNITYDLRGSRWLLISYSEDNGNVHRIDATREFWFYLSKTGDSIQGTSGCNRFAGTYHFASNHLLDTCITTAVGCSLTSEFYSAVSDATAL